MRQSLLWLLFFGAAPGPPAKAQLVDTVVYFPLPLMDLGIRATVREGVWIAGGPSLRSYQGADSSMYVLLQVHPDTLFSWAGHASVVLNRPLLTAEDERIQWTRELRAFRSPGSLRLGRTVKKGRLKGDRWLSLGDSTHRWHVDLSGHEADSLLRLLVAVSAASGPIDTVAPPAFDEDSVDTPVTQVRIPKPAFKGVGRVLAQYVVGPDGRVEPGSIVFLLATSPDHAKEARAILLKAAYTPAIKSGEPVRQLVQQAISWRVYP